MTANLTPTRALAQLLRRTSAVVFVGYTGVMLLLERRLRRTGGPGIIAGDAIEGISLLKVLNGTRVAANTQRARTAALSKFAVLAVSLGYVAAGGGQSLG
ncbi:MAG: hypothetical protein JO082_09650 [Mycobacterium sp.]|nr:hypothetical protein [Mycobacterium sp.]